MKLGLRQRTVETATVEMTGNELIELTGETEASLIAKMKIATGTEMADMTMIATPRTAAMTTAMPVIETVETISGVTVTGTPVARMIGTGVIAMMVETEGIEMTGMTRDMIAEIVTTAMPEMLELVVIVMSVSVKAMAGMIVMTEEIATTMSAVTATVTERGHLTT